MAIANKYKRHGNLKISIGYILYIGLAALLVFIDANTQSFVKLRHAFVSSNTYFFQGISESIDWMRSAANHFSSKSSLLEEIERLKRERLIDYARLQLLDSLEHQLKRSQNLLRIYEGRPEHLYAAKLVFAPPNSSNRYLILESEDIASFEPGWFVIDEMGLVGQISQMEDEVFVVRLISDRNSTLQVEIARTGQRGVIYGLGASNELDLRFVPTEADVQKGDVVVTTGVGGSYPRGVPVGVVRFVNSNVMSNFSEIRLKPSAGLGVTQNFLVITKPIEEPLDFDVLDYGSR